MEVPNEMLAFCRVNCNVPVYLELIDYYCLEGQEMVGICKTFWLKLIQRKWKSIFKKRKEIMKKRMMPHSLKYKEINGVWPNNCIHLPTISSH